jgi:methionine sulfoxide reductase heme-binding subunit
MPALGSPPTWLTSTKAKAAWMFILALPGLLLLALAFNDGLGANPAEALTRQSGEWALRGLILVLLIRPLQVWTGWGAWLRFRRASGVAVFVYGALHMLCWAWFEQGLDWADLVNDIAKRPFILVGVLTLSLMLPLAITSNTWSLRQLGGLRWKQLHRLVYVCAPLAVLHFFWMREGKQRFTEVWIYGGLLAALLLWRVHAARRQAQGKRTS